MLLLRPRTSDQKPPIGLTIQPGHPLTDGLVRAWLFNERTRRAGFDRVRGDLLTQVRDQVDVGPMVGPWGDEYQSGADGGNQGGFTGSQNNTEVAATGVTIAIRFRIHTTNGFLANYTGLVVAADASGPVPRLMYLNTGQVLWGVSQGGLTDLGVTGPTLVAGVNYDVVASYQRDPAIATFAGTFLLLVNGQFYGPNTRNAAGTFSGTWFTGFPWLVGRYPPDLGTQSHLFVAHVLLWNRGLTPTEMRAVAERPYEPFTSAAPRFWQKLAGPAAPMNLRRGRGPVLQAVNRAATY